MSDEDFYEYIERTKESAPDGVFDASEYVSSIEKVIHMLDSIDDIDSDDGRMIGMMGLVSMMTESELDAVAVGYVFITLLSSLDDLVDGSYQSFVMSMKNDVVPVLKESQSSVPYWR